MIQDTQTSKKIWTILELVEWSTKYLNEKGIDEARLNAELLLCHVFNCQRIELYTHFDKPLGPNELAAYKLLLKRRLASEPLQYIVGETEFMGLKFFLDRRVLIPRRDTEVLVEQVIKQYSNYETPINILDIGTGSGNIAVSLARYLKNSFVVAVDVSLDALEVAKINADKNYVADKIVFYQKDIKKDFNYDEKFDAVVSNPPYISKEEFLLVNKEVSEYEPQIATTDENNGLTFYERIADVSRNLLKHNGWLFLEIAYNQKDSVSQILKIFGYSNIEAVKDYSGNYRVLKGKL